MVEGYVKIPASYGKLEKRGGEVAGRIEKFRVGWRSLGRVCWSIVKEGWFLEEYGRC